MSEIHCIHNTILACLHFAMLVQYTCTCTVFQQTITTWNFLEVNELGVSSQRGTRSGVGVDVALSVPRIVVSSETVVRSCARLLTRAKSLELAEDLSASRNVEAFVNGDDLLCKTTNRFNLVDEAKC